MSGKRKVALKRRACPSCGEIGSLRKILYGLPDETFDHEKYIVGGCLVSHNDPQVGCVECGWEGDHRDDFFLD